jgi:hypothetical protein
MGVAHRHCKQIRRTERPAWCGATARERRSPGFSSAKGGGETPSGVAQRGRGRRAWERWGGRGRDDADESGMRRELWWRWHGVGTCRGERWGGEEVAETSIGSRGHCLCHALSLSRSRSRPCYSTRSQDAVSLGTLGRGGTKLSVKLLRPAARARFTHLS